MFEVGKKYSRGITEYTCIFADNTGALLEYRSYNGLYRTWKRSMFLHYYKEIKPKIKVERWCTVGETGRIGGTYYEEAAAVKAARDFGRVAVIHIIREVEEGEGLS